MGAKITDLGLGVKLIEPDHFHDYRGYYCETYSSRTLASLGINDVFVQDNEAYSKKAGTVRGLHFQNLPKAQTKLLRCVKGKIIDYAVDLRKDSPTYMQSVSLIMEAGDGKQIYIPKGFGHLCISLVDDTIINYKVDALYDPALDRAIRYNDPDIGLDLPELELIVSAKDNAAPFLKDSDVNF